MRRFLRNSAAASFLVAALPALAQPEPFFLKVVVSEQALYVLRSGTILDRYPVSTSKYGIGNREGSFQTPLGRHRIAKKAGYGAPLGSVLEDRRLTGKVAAIDTGGSGAPRDVITTRVLWLQGLETGVNRGEGIDSLRRFIYIHGTTSEGLIGSPASNGCVRMRNRDVAELFDLVPEGTDVEIVA